MSQPAEVTERGFCLFVLCHSGDTSLKSPPGSTLEYVLYSKSELHPPAWAAFLHLTQPPFNPQVNAQHAAFKQKEALPRA